MPRNQNCSTYEAAAPVDYKYDGQDYHGSESFDKCCIDITIRIVVASVDYKYHGQDCRGPESFD